MKKLNCEIAGMRCGGCAAGLQNALTKMPGVISASVNFASKSMYVEYDEKKLQLNDIEKQVTSLGYSMGNAQQHDTEEKKRNSFAALIFAAAEFIVAMLTMATDFNHTLSGIIQLVLTSAVIWFGRAFFVNGVKKLLHRTPNMDTLVALGTGSAYVYSVVMMFYGGHFFFESCAVVIALVGLGKYLEERTQEKSIGAIKGLLSLVPQKCITENRGEIDTAQLLQGDIILLKAGEKAPCDCIVTSGTGAVSESHITGESMPREVGENDSILCGSLISDGFIKARAQQVGSDTLLSKIVEITAQAQSKKAPIAKTADTVSLYFVPFVLCIAIISAIIWLLCAAEISFALTVFVSVLVIACPCSLGLATPLSVISATQRAAKEGIIIKSGDALEAAAKIKNVVFDKTGTLTSGEVTISDIFCYGIAKDELVNIACSLEKNANHPIAHAVMKLGAGASEASEIKTLTGFGISGNIGGSKVLIGKRELMNEIDLSACQNDVQRLEADGKSLLYISRDGKLVGLMGAADKPSQTAAKAVSQLEKMGCHVYMLTGDNEKSARAAATEIGVKNVISGVTPDKKSDAIDKIKKSGATLMVGDGINDAPALSKADVGVAMGRGTDIAEQSSQIVLMKNDVSDVVKMLRLSRKTLMNIKENLFWAFVYNCIGIVFATGAFYSVLGFLLSPAVAGGAMALSSICVVLNALRLSGAKLLCYN